MGLLIEMMFVVVRPLYAVLLAIGAVLGVAASVIIMNLLVGYFAVASDAYISVHPHVTVHGSWTPAQAAELADKLKALDPQIRAAAPALHFDRTLTIASVNVISELCDPNQSVEANCAEKRDASKAASVYAYDVSEQRQVDVQVRGVAIVDGDTIADYRKLMAGVSDLGRLERDADSGGNVLPVAFLAQDTLIANATGTFLVAPGALADRYPRFWRLHGLIKLGAKSSGAPLLVTGLSQAMALAPPGLTQPNVIEIRLARPLDAERIGAVVRAALGTGTRTETWVDKERSAFQFLNATWVMVFSVMLSICLVVAISIYSTLTLSILRNRWKVALLNTLGYTPFRIMVIFMSFAGGVALIGIVVGVAIGQTSAAVIGGALYQAFLNVPPERFAATLTWQPALWMAAATLVIFTLSAIMPVRRAMRIEPADALRGH